MKILLISNNFTKRVGDEIFVVELAKYFTKQHEVHLLTSTTDLSLNEYYNIPGLIIHKKKIIKKPYWLQILINAYLNAKYSKDLKDRLKLDIIHSNTWESFFCDVLVLHSCYKIWLKTANQILEQESSYPKYLLRKIWRHILPKNRVLLAIEKRVLEKDSKKIIVASEFLKRGILENYKVSEEKITVIPFGANLDKFKLNPQKRTEIRKKYKIGENDICLILSGYEFKRKGLKYVIEALPSVGSNVKLLAVGEENPRVYKELASNSGVSDRVIFTGFVPEIKDYYSAADIYVFPTTYEPFGITTLEAMATGLPVIISREAGSAEVIKEGQEGLLLNNPRDPQEIAEKINILVNNTDLRTKMRERALKTAQEYSWDKVAQRILEVYKEVLNKEK